MTTPTVLLERDESIAVMTFNRPEIHNTNKITAFLSGRRPEFNDPE